MADQSKLTPCAGILLRASGPSFLLVRNADDGQWVQPGGHVDADESTKDAAVRECIEEVGQLPEGQLRMFRRSQSGGTDFTCYIQDVELFTPVLDDESTDYIWCNASNLPAGTHPEVARSIDLASGNELDIAKSIRSGELPSPQQYENLWLFDVRITGTGTSYRTGLDEYVYRPPENFLSDEFMERCNGLPLIFEHPGESILDTDEYRNRAIGNVILPYIKGDEVWGVAKVYDADAAQLMTTSHLSTSPAVVFREAGSTSSVELSDGSTLLIEGKPSYLDHLAICEAGVWDKGGEPSGIQLTGDTEMADEEKVPAWADSLNKRFDEVCSRLDAMEKGGEKSDSFEGLEKKVEGEGYDKEAAEKIAGKVAEEKKADGAEKEGEEEKKEEGEAEKHLEAAEKDGKKEERAERKDGEFMDAQKRENAELKAQIKAMHSRIESIAKPLTANDRDQLSAAQARADSVARLFGDSVNPPMHGESPIAYRKRLAAKFQKHSAANKTTRLDALDESVFSQIEDRIYADAQQIAASPAVMQPGRLMEHRETDRSGRVITTYTGDPMAWMKPFMAVSAISRINTNHPKGA